MIKAFSAYTNEVDDVKLAVSELMEMLDFEGKLLKNTIGILSCFAEYVESGVVEALYEALPFEVVGTTTTANAAGDEQGEITLCLLVITSDEVQFATGLTEAVEGEDAAVLEAAYQKATAGREGTPALMLSFAPLLTNVGVDFFSQTMDEVSGGVPNFGALTVDHTADYHEARVLYNGDSWQKRYAFVLLYGPVNPKFFIGTISDEKVFAEKGVVTAAQGSQLQSVNDKPMVDYLLSLGLAQDADGSIIGINSFPIIVDYNDGTEPVVRAMFALTPEGYAVCGGRVQVGATLTMGRFDPDEIVSTSTNALNRALEAGPFNVMLIYSCVGRYFALQYDQSAELDMTIEAMKDQPFPYMMAYCGGEICPVYGRDGQTSNRGHNNTYIICAF